MEIDIFMIIDFDASKTNMTIYIHKSMMYENGMDKNQRDIHELHVFCVASMEE
jgi:hypothetical protein